MSDLKELQKGRLTSQQFRFLLTQLFIRVALIILVALPVGMGFLRARGSTAGGGSILIYGGWLIIALSIASLAYFSWTYVLDLFFSSPICMSGRVHKYRRKRLRGPDLFCLTIESHQFLNVEIIVQAEIWETIQDDQRYVLCYAKHTRWLLSSHRL